MKIAIIVNPLIPVPPEYYGGIERIVYMLIQNLQQYGHTVTLYGHPDSQPGCTLVPYSEGKRYSVQDMATVNRLTFKISRSGYDLVHTFGRMSNIALLMLSKLPKIVSYQLPPTIKQVKKAVNIARKDSLYFTGCSNYIAAQIAPYGNVTTIYNGVDMNDYQFKASVPADAPLVFLGRIQEEKGTVVAIEIARRSGKKLVIAGNVPAEQKHQSYFNEQVKPHIDGKQVTYIGAVNNAQKNKLLGNALAFLMPVTWDEPFGIVMAEALACGTPVIGFKRGAVPEIVENGVDGFTGDTIEELITAVDNVHQISRQTCRTTAELRFSADVIIKQYEQLYSAVISAS